MSDPTPNQSDSTQASEEPQSEAGRYGFNKPKEFPPPPYLQGLSSTDSVRTPGGHYRTESLFLELWKPIATSRPVYSLLREDREDPREPGRTVYSFQRRYLELGDPTGYRAAIDLLGSWKHWEKIRDRPWMKPHIDAWNQEIVAQLNSKGLAAIIKAAERGDLKAAEYLIDYTTNGPPKRHGRGRPTKAEIRQAAQEIAAHDTELTEDAERIGLTNG